jgi:hypothetical protein
VHTYIHTYIHRFPLLTLYTFSSSYQLAYASFLHELCSFGAAPGNFDKIIVNGDLNESVEQLVETLEDWFPWIKR